MAYLEGYKYDIFISYCHSDNEKQFNESLGWVEYFYKNLETSLLKLVGSDIAIWWDERRIEGNTLFNDSIADAVKNSAILICINSPTYLNSEYCEKELGLFYKEYKDKIPGIQIGDRSRILNVLLYNIPYTEWPSEFGGTAGFPFHDAVEEEDKGHPLDTNTDQFKEKFFSFCDSVDKLIKGLKGGTIDSRPIFDIFFGDVSDNLRPLQKKTIAELAKQTITERQNNIESKKSKFEIVSNVPPPYEKNEHEALVNKKLEKVEFSVHLLDQVPGRNITEEEPLCYPQKQAELSLLTSTPKFIWVPAGLDIKTVEEEKYKIFLQDLENGTLPGAGYKYVRSTKSEVAQQVIDMANEVYGNWSAVNNGPMKVLLDTHFNDQLYALEVYKKLVENNIQPIFNSQEGDPKKNASLLEERIRQVSKLIFFYGKISRDWIIERVKIAIKIIIEKKIPIKEFFVLMLPPHKDLSPDKNLPPDIYPIPINLGPSPIRINLINNSDGTQLDPNVLQQIFNSLKAVA